MGSSRLELPTSRLSGARSNLLSYEPIRFPLFATLVDSAFQLPPPSWVVLVLRFSFADIGSGAVPGRTGDDGIRTHDPLLAGQVLSQLSYTPMLDTHLLHSFPMNAEFAFKLTQN